MRRRSEEGYVTVLVAVFMASLFFVLAAISVDVARWYVEVERVQKAADAAALAGVTHMPQDLAAARNDALDVAARNGYPTGPQVSLTAEPGTQPSKLKVTITSTITNTFGSFFGVDKIRIAKAAVADYLGPQPMGSPCNTLGNEPPGSSGFGPVASVLAVPVGASCPRFPEFWPSVAGPEAAKTQGDQFADRYCSSGESQCDGEVNTDFEPRGYLMLVRIGQGAVGQPVHLQLYDPAYVSTGSECENVPPTLSNASSSNSPNPFVTDARTRYDDSANDYCPGDNPNAGSGQRRGQERPPVTSFALRAPTDTGNPWSATPVSGCVRQYPGYGVLGNNTLIEGRNGYDANVARVFHQWKELCSFVPSRVGDYYLQVRSNVALGGAVNDDGSYKPANVANSPVLTQQGDDPSMLQNGTNRYAVRAYVTGGSGNSALAVTAYESMPIFANSSSSAPEFNLIRLLPGAAGKTLSFTFFDVGDAATSGTLSVLRPNDATGSALSGCRATGYVTRTLPTCSLSGISSSTGWNGKAETIYVPIPENYSCNYGSAGGCWFRLRVGFGSGSVTDATTWSASVSGDPVRLVE